MSAYVTYERRADAEQACRALHANLNIKGSRVRVMWARKRTRAAAPPGTAAAAEQPQRPAKRPHLPPGVAPPPGARCGHACGKRSRRPRTGVTAARTLPLPSESDSSSTVSPPSAQPER